MLRGKRWNYHWIWGLHFQTQICSYHCPHIPLRCFLEVEILNLWFFSLRGFTFILLEAIWNQYENDFWILDPENPWESQIHLPRRAKRNTTLCPQSWSKSNSTSPRNGGCARLRQEVLVHAGSTFHKVFHKGSVKWTMSTLTHSTTPLAHHLHTKETRWWDEVREGLSCYHAVQIAMFWDPQKDSADAVRCLYSSRAWCTFFTGCVEGPSVHRLHGSTYWVPVFPFCACLSYDHPFLLIK